MGRLVDLRLTERWRERLGRFEAGRLGVAAFCRREGVCEASFYQWRRKLGPAEGSVVRATMSDESVLKAAFQQVELVAAPAGGSATIRLPGGVVFEIDGDGPLVAALFGQALGDRSLISAREPGRC